MTNSIHTRTKAAAIGVLHLLPDQFVTPADAALAVNATAYAVENYYAPSTIASKVWDCSLLVIQDHSKYPFTRMVLKGIKAVNQIEVPVGVVLGKDILHHFNSMLRPTENYYDLLLVTFD